MVSLKRITLGNIEDIVQSGSGVAHKGHAEFKGRFEDKDFYLTFTGVNEKREVTIRLQQDPSSETFLEQVDNFLKQNDQYLAGVLYKPQKVYRFMGTITVYPRLSGTLYQGGCKEDSSG
jgi:hypothetical protein